ncbi:MAG: hypothetical protein AB1641_14255 [Thermodesulfobacteriota bacterium]
MAFSGQAANKLVFAALYAGVVILTAWGGMRLINYALCSRFHRDFLLKWEVALKAYRQEKGSFPDFIEGRHGEFMEDLIKRMRGRGVTPPESNTARPYVYNLKKIGRPDEVVLVLGLPDRLVVYGLAPETYATVDGFIDDQSDAGAGWFTGRIQPDGTMVGVWRL